MSHLDDVRKEYDRLAESYDEKWASYLEATHKKVLGLLPKGPGRLLDASGGTGLLAEKIIRNNPKQVTLLELSTKMAHKAQQRLQNKATIVEGDVHNIPMKDDFFDLVVNVSALHYYQKPMRAINEMQRVLKKGGTLILIDWCREPLHFKIYDIFKRLTNKAHQKSYTRKEVTTMLKKSGMRITHQEKFKTGLWSLFAVVAKAPDA